MSSGAYMRLFWGDLLKNTMHIGQAEFGGYMLLCGHYFEHGGLPDDDRELARIARVTVPVWRKQRPRIERFFEPGWRHPFLDREREHARSKGERASKNASARWKIAPTIAIPDSAYGKARDESETGKKLIKSMDDLCDRIADAEQPHMRMQCSSESESESKDTTLNTRARLDDLQGRLLEVAPSLEAKFASAPGLMALGPIVGCLDGGCDLELDVLPVVRAKAATGKMTHWQFCVDAIWDARNRRLAAAEPRAIPQQPVNSQAPLAKDWRPSADLVDYGKSLGLSQADVDWTAEEMRNWAPGKAREDWPGVFKGWLVRKAERKAEKNGMQPPSLSRMIEPARRFEKSEDVLRYEKMKPGPEKTALLMKIREAMRDEHAREGETA